MIDLTLPGLSFDGEGEAHDYSLDGARLTSVTDLVKQYSPDVAWNRIVGATAKRDGVTPEDVRAGWSRKRDAGTAAHAYAARMAAYVAAGRSGTAPEAGDCDHELFPGYAAGVFNFYLDVNPAPVAWEAPIAWPAAGIAGTLDLLADVAGMSGRRILFDFKTDAEFVYNDRGRMKPPIEHLPSRNYTQHALQTSCYRLMIHEQYGERVDGIVLVRLTGGSYVLEPVVWLRGEVEDIVADHNNKETPA